jgi:hypothetical protein
MLGIRRATVHEPLMALRRWCIRALRRCVVDATRRPQETAHLEGMRLLARAMQRAAVVSTEPEDRSPL